MIAVQTAIGGIGEKATTVLSSSYLSMISSGNFQYGLNESGIFLLNQGEANTASFSLLTSDFGTPKNKQFEFIYVTINSAISKVISLTVRLDDTTSYTYTATTQVAGIQRLRFKIGLGAKGRVWRVSVSSPAWFEIHQIEALFSPLSL